MRGDELVRPLSYIRLSTNTFDGNLTRDTLFRKERDLADLVASIHSPTSIDIRSCLHTFEIDSFFLFLNECKHRYDSLDIFIDNETLDSGLTM